MNFMFQCRNLNDWTPAPETSQYQAHSHEAGVGDVPGPHSFDIIYTLDILYQYMLTVRKGF